MIAVLVASLDGDLLCLLRPCSIADPRLHKSTIAMLAPVL